MDDIDDNDDNDSNTSFSTQSKARMNDSHKRLRNNSGQGVKVQSSINQFIGRKLSPNEIPTFYRLLLRMTISNGWAFQWVENLLNKIF